MRRFRVFVRNWWKENPAWPDTVEDVGARKTTIGWAETAEEAQEICRTWNAAHKPGRLSRKAEYTDG